MDGTTETYGYIAWRPTDLQIVGIADLDQDGEFDDILWRNTVYGGVKVWLTAWPVFSQVPIGWMP